MNTFKFLFNQTFVDIWRRKDHFVPAVLTMFLCSWLLVGVLFFCEILRQDTFFSSKQWTEKWQVEVFFKDGLKAQESKIYQEIKNGPLSRSWTIVQEISSEQAIDVFKKAYGQEMLSAVDFNPLPYSLKIEYQNRNSLDAFKNSIQSFQKSDEVQYVQSQFEIVDAAVQWKIKAYQIGVGIALFLMGVLWFILKNMLTLSFFSRSEEVKTMNLLGATSRMMYFPFLFESMILGVVGSFFASICWIAIYDTFVVFFPWLSGQEQPLQYSILESGACVLIMLFVGGFLTTKKMLKKIRSDAFYHA